MGKSAWLASGCTGANGAPITNRRQVNNLTRKGRRVFMPIGWLQAH